EIGSVLPGSPAEKAGIKPGDVVKSIDGKEVGNFALMRHRLGAKYEGDTVNIVVVRGGKEETLNNVQMGSAASARGQGFLGTAPTRDGDKAGVQIRSAYPKSAAETAKLKAGDRILKIGRPGAPGQPSPMQPVQNRDQLLTLLETAPPGVDVKLEVKQGDKTNTVTAKLGELPDDVPAELPEKDSFGKALGKPKDKPKDDKKDDKKDEEKKGPETGLVKRTSAAGDRTYYLFVPKDKDYDPNVAHALVVWLHPAGKGKEGDIEKFTDTWEDYCAANHLIIVAPTTDNENGWTPGDSEFVVEAGKATMGAYTIDKRRVVAHGMGVGGQMAIYLGFHSRDLFRGVATTGASVTGNPKERIANQPLSFFMVVGEKDPLREAVKDSKAKLAENHFSV